MKHQHKLSLFIIHHSAFIISASGCVEVVAVEGRATVAPEIELEVRGFLRVFSKRALEVLAALAVARFFDRAFQFPVAALVVVLTHVLPTPVMRPRFKARSGK